MIVRALLASAAERSLPLEESLPMASTTMELVASDESAMQLCARVAETSPLIQCITNYVSKVLASGPSCTSGLPPNPCLRASLQSAQGFFAGVHDFVANTLLAAGASPAMVCPTCKPAVCLGAHGLNDRDA